MDEMPTNELRIIGFPRFPEVKPGDDIGAMIADAVDRSGLGLQPGDVIVCTHKIVSKAEGRLVDLNTVLPSDFARHFARESGKDPRQVEVVLQESARIVRMNRGIIIAETRHGFVCANAGVDASNVAPDTVCLLPVDPDLSAQKIRDTLEHRLGTEPGVIISDSFGRPWRNGIVDIAIGVAGMAPLTDYRGHLDPAGHELGVTVMAVADEIAAAAELVTHKLEQRPVALVRGYIPALEADDGVASDLVMDSERDLFR